MPVISPRRSSRRYGIAPSAAIPPPSGRGLAVGVREHVQHVGEPRRSRVLVSTHPASNDLPRRMEMLALNDRGFSQHDVLGRTCPVSGQGAHAVLCTMSLCMHHIR
jgi:hypothetical protein